MQRRTHLSLSYLPRTFVAQASPMLTSFSRKERCQLSLAMTKVLFGYMNTPEGKPSRRTAITFVPDISADPESKSGQHLLCRTEFHGQSESHSSVVIARRSEEDHDLPQAKLLCGKIIHIPYVRSKLYSCTLRFYRWLLSSLTPVDESVFKRLQLLQGQLTRNIQHFAGLNPKAFRFVVRDLFVVRLLTGE